MEALEFKDVIGYFPYNMIWLDKKDKVKYSTAISDKLAWFLHEYTPALRPISDLYKTIKHREKEIIPLVELARIAFPDRKWDDEIKIMDGLFWVSDYNGYSFEFIKGDFMARTDEGEFCFVDNKYKLFDFIHELRIDYRGLINWGLAVDINKLDKHIDDILTI